MALTAEVVTTLSPKELQRFFSTSLQLSDPRMLERQVCFDYNIFYFFDGQEVGDGSIALYVPQEQITLHQFYPLKRMTSLKRNHLGTLAHAQTMIELAAIHQNAGSFLVDHGIHSSYEAQQFFRAMGINPFARYAFDEYLEKSLIYARSKGFVF